MTMYSRAHTRKKGYGEIAALLVACGAVIYFFTIVFAPNLTRLTHGFIAYYTAAQLARQGHADARLYDPVWFRAQTTRAANGAADDIFNANPPALALLLLPLTFFALNPARALWASVNVAFLGGAVFLLMRVTGLSRAHTLGLGAFFLFAAPLAENFRLGQVYILLLFLFALALYLLEREKNYGSGIALGAAWILKTSGALLWLMLLARRQTRVLVGGVIAIAGGFLLSLPFVGLETWRVYALEAFPAFLNAPDYLITAHQTLNSFLQHLLRYDARLNPYPLWDAPMLARGLYLGLAVVLVGASLWLTRAQSNPRAFAAFLTLSIILSPVAEEYHFVLLLLPAFVLAAAFQSWREKSFWIFVAALFLLAFPVPYKAPALANGWYALFAYPRLYSALLLWGLLMWKR